MIRVTVALSVLTAFGASILVATACAPQDSAPVLIAPRTTAGKAIDECLAQIRGRAAVVTGRSIAVCEVPEEEADAEASGSASSAPSRSRSDDLVWVSGETVTQPTKAYQLDNRIVQYKVENQNGRLAIVLNVGLSYPEKQPEATRVGVHRVLSQQCAPKIEALWKRENVDLDLRINTMKPDVDFDQELNLVVAPEQKNAIYPRWVAAGWPDQGDLYPVGRQEDEVDCKALGNGDDVSRCRWEKYEAANERFCVSLALKVGEWLGLENPQTKSCAVNPEAAASVPQKPVVNPPEKPATKPDQSTQAPTQGPGAEADPSGDSIMKVAADPTAHGSVFWSKAKVTGVDLKTVLGPACPAFKALHKTPTR